MTRTITIHVIWIGRGWGARWTWPARVHRLGLVRSLIGIGYVSWKITRPRKRSAQRSCDSPANTIHVDFSVGSRNVGEVTHVVHSTRHGRRWALKNSGCLLFAFFCFFFQFSRSIRRVATGFLSCQPLCTLACEFLGTESFRLQLLLPLTQSLLSFCLLELLFSLLFCFPRFSGSLQSSNLLLPLSLTLRLSFYFIVGDDWWWDRRLLDWRRG
mmetsp:Transcript_36332/g.82864  ORF Transcript_36332/g.82864 Transcript_36332/m.82864 type:complete len:213 (+) Transcript_36332:1498-2136(+)